MRRAIYIVVVLLLLTACGEVIDIVPQPKPEPDPTPDEGVKVDVLNLTLRHSNEELVAPVWYGEDVRGQVDWGDGVKEEYTEGVAHDYAKSDRFEAVFEMENVEGFEIEQLGDLEHLDIEY